MENDKLFFVMCIFACLPNSRRKENILLILSLQRKNTLPDSLMSIFREILKPNKGVQAVNVQKVVEE